MTGACHFCLSFPAGPVSISPDPALGSSKLKKSKKRLAELKSFSLEEPLQREGMLERAGTLTRSKTYDPPSRSPGRDAAMDRRRSISCNIPKHNATFHKIFRDVPEDEELIDSFSCALQKEVLYHGRLYISTNHLSFYCSMLRKEIKVLIPVRSVIILKKANTALLVPNALSVRTAEGDKYLFGSLRNREISYQAVLAVCTHLQDGSSCSTPLSLPTDPGSEQSTKVLNSSHSDLEQNLQESDSTELCVSTTPAVPCQVQSRIRSIPSEVDGAIRGPWINGDLWQGKVALEDTNRAQWAEPRAVNVLLLIYLLLVVLLLMSSGYIGLRIMQLENQLSTLGAWPEHATSEGYQDT
ncbi:hypothetical protein FKM82_015020 [Ascaphus truei]